MIDRNDLEDLADSITLALEKITDALYFLFNYESAVVQSLQELVEIEKKKHDVELGKEHDSNERHLYLGP